MSKRSGCIDLKNFFKEKELSPITKQVKALEEKYEKMESLAGEVIATLIVNLEKCPNATILDGKDLWERFKERYDDLKEVKK